jgi:HEAT repeat protein
VQALKGEALQVFAVILREGTQGDRLSAVNSLVRNGDRDAVHLVAEALLQDEAPFVRRAAAEGLAKLHSIEAAVPALRQAALNDDISSIRWASGVALVLWSLTEADMIEKLLDAPATLAAAAVSLQDVVNLQQFPGPLWSLAKREFIEAFAQSETYNVVERAAMLKTLAQMQTRDAIPLLRATLNDLTEDPFVRGAAAFGLGILTVKESVLDLIQGLDSDFEALQLAAAGALGRLGDARAIAPLSITLKGARVDDVRMSAASALAMFGAPAIAPLAQSLQSDRSPLVRQAALQALARAGGPQATQAVLAFLQSNYLQNCDPTLCSSLALEILVTLAKLGQGALALQLLNATLGAVRDSLPFLFLFAESSLVRTLNEVGRVQPPMYSILLNDPSSFVKALALSSLANTQSCLAQATFGQFLGAADSFVRRAALEGYSICANAEEIGLFAQAISDRDRRVRAAGHFVLAQRGDARSVIPLQSAMRSESIAVRLDAAGAALAYSQRMNQLQALLNCRASARTTPDRFLNCLER